MVRSVLYLRPRGGDYRAVVEYYRRTDVLGRAASIDGCLGTELHVPTDESGPLLVTALWESESAYGRWLQDDFRRESGAELAELLEEAPEPGVGGALFDVVLSANGFHSDAAPEGSAGTPGEGSP
jgi:heme-degrading monooxygenase HmoA